MATLLPKTWRIEGGLSSGADMWVRLTRRLATCIDGVDLSTHQIGDVFEVSRHDGELLIAEAWAVNLRRRPAEPRVKRLKARDRRVASLIGQLRSIARQIERRFIQSHEQRRVDDLVRDQWHDAHARVVGHAH